MAPNPREYRPTTEKDWSAEFNKAWIENAIDEKAVEYAEKFGRYLSQRNEGNFSTSQFRNVYGELKRIQMNGIEQNKVDFLLLKPKMAYAAKRATDSKGAKDFEKVLKKAHESVKIEEVNFEKRFNNLCQLMEAILAYHKAEGGK